MKKKVTFQDVVDKALLEVILEKGENNVAHVTEMDIIRKVAELSSKSEIILKVVCDAYGQNAEEIQKKALELSRQ